MAVEPIDSDVPVEANATLVFDTPSAICSLGWRPHLLTGMLLGVLQQHFGRKNNLESPVLRRFDKAETGGVNDYLWRAGHTTGILVDSRDHWLKNLEEKRPAVLVARNSWDVERRGIDDRHLGQAFDGNEQYTTFVRGSHTLFCVAVESGEADLIAVEVYKTLIEFGPLIREYMALHRFTTVKIDAVKLIEADATINYMTPIVVAYAYEESWTIYPHAPLLNTVRISTNLVP